MRARSEPLDTEHSGSKVDADRSLGEQLRFIDLFAGLGGFHLALEQLGHRCVFASELDPKLRDLYKDNFGVKVAGDIRQVEAADVPEHEILCAGLPCQPVETTFNIQRRMADWHFARAESWPELVAAHDAWAGDYNAQAHWAHRERKDGRRSPQEVLGWLTGVRYRPEDLERAFFSTRFSRVLDPLGYARFRDWRLYGEEGLARKEAAVWLQPGSLTVEFAGETLSRYDVELAAGTGELRSVSRPRLFETSHALPQLRLFALDEAGWIKALKLDGYASRGPRKPVTLQDVLFPFLAGTGG